MARVVEGASGRSNPSPGIARWISSSVAPHRRCQGPITSRYVPIRPTAMRTPTPMPAARPSQAISPASATMLAMMHPRTISRCSASFAWLVTSWMRPYGWCSTSPRDGGPGSVGSSRLGRAPPRAQPPPVRTGPP